MSIAPETAMSPLAEAPSDRPTVGLEEWARQGLALMFGDRVLDQNEMRIIRELMEQIAMRAQAAGGIGVGASGSPEEAAQQQLSPMEMNAQTEDFGAGAGEPVEEEF